MEKQHPKNKKVRNILLKLLSYGLVCEDDDIATDIQIEIKNKVLYENANFSDIVDQYIEHSNDLCKQKKMYDKLKSSVYTRKTKGMCIDISPRDIIINEYCPFLGSKLEYKTPNRAISETVASNDRFDNSKGYVKGNVWVISKLANSMKNSATIDELKTFCYNVLKQYQENNSKTISSI